MPGRPLRALVMSALRVEYLAMRAHLADLRDEEHRSGTRFEAGRLRDGRCEVVLAQAGAGNVKAGVIAERAIGMFEPDLLLFVGVAGALHDDLRLADVVVATRVDAYHGGTAAADFLARPQTWPANYRLEELARLVDRTGGWQRRAGEDGTAAGSAVYFRPVAAGEVVLDSRDSALFDQLRRLHNDAAAIAMEDAGVAQAAHLNDALPVLVIRGISDHADGHKTDADRLGWQQQAAAAAAAFAAALLARHTPVPGPPAAAAARQAPAGPGVPLPGVAARRKLPQFTYVQRKTTGFVGRDHAFAEFAAFLAAHPSGYLIVEGLPGAGKTSLLAEEVRRRDWPAHFNIAAQGINSVAAFQESLHGQLAGRYALRLRPPGAGDDGDGRYLGRLLEETAGLLSAEDQLVIVVDALDEASGEQPGANALFLPTVLPAGLFLLVSRRARTAPLHLDGASAVVDLMARPAENRRDAALFIRNSLARPELAARIAGVADREQVVSGLLDRSELNFMYLVYVLRDIEDGRMRPDDLSGLPHGLSAYYERHLGQMLSRGTGATLSLQTIYALATIREPVPASLLAGVMRVSEVEVVLLLADWAQFLQVTRHGELPLYSFYHQGFCDFLMRNDTVRACGVDLGELSSTVGRRLMERLGLDLGGPGQAGPAL